MLEPGAMRRAALLLTICSVLAVPTTASAACSWSAKLHAGTHHPRAGKPWPIRVTTSLSGDRMSAYYQFVFGNHVVAEREINPHSSAPGKKRFHFRGSFRDPTVTWPRRAIGIPLTFRVVVHSRCCTKRLNYKDVVRKEMAFEDAVAPLRSWLGEPVTVVLEPDGTVMRGPLSELGSEGTDGALFAVDAEHTSGVAIALFR